MKCRKTKGCNLPRRHTGTCSNCKGHAIPPYKPVKVVRVLSRNPVVLDRKPEV
jgi:hypothetical protein